MRAVAAFPRVISEPGVDFMTWDIASACKPGKTPILDADALE
jgi:hypothetical protein